ncbi:hypothetical protein ACHAQA_003280 [Verticillium albo-atrum]
MSDVETVSAFVEGAPPGELADVIADIKSLTIDSPNIVSSLGPAFEKYNEEQLITVKLPGSSQSVIISAHNSLGQGQYFDVESSSSFSFDHSTQVRRFVRIWESRADSQQKASDVQSYVLEGAQSDLVKSTLKSLGPYVKEHFANAAYGAYPIEDDSKVAVVIVSNKYSPNNFWNGRWRSIYIFDPASGTLEGSIKVDVHYYEDGNVRLLTDRPSTASVSSGTGAGIIKEISATEKKYQDELNRGFTSLSEGAFKGLRRQLPVTRQKIEWDKVTSYRLGQDIGGGSGSRRNNLDRQTVPPSHHRVPIPSYHRLDKGQIVAKTKTQTIKMSAEFTFQDVAEHNTKNDLYMVVHDKVYDCTKFVDEHPGGEEVMLDVGGQDATEAFEDVGHSDEARDTLAQLEVGTLKRQAGDPAPSKQPAAASSSNNNADTSGIGIGLYAVLLVGGAIAYGAYQYLQQQEQQKSA